MLFTSKATICYLYQGWTQRGCVRGGGALKAEVLNWLAQATSGGRVWERGLDLPRKKMKIYVSENAFQAILKPIFPYSMTSILSKVRHSNTLFLAISFAFPCHQVWVSPMFRKTAEPLRGGGGLKFEEKKARKKQPSPHQRKNLALGLSFHCIFIQPNPIS